MQTTKFNSFQNKALGKLSGSIIGPWKIRSIGLISLLFGFYLGSNLTVYYLEKLGQRSFVTLLMVLIIELLIRSRSFLLNRRYLYIPIVVDNLRIGAVYAVVLEAFKLGS